MRALIIALGLGAMLSACATAPRPGQTAANELIAIEAEFAREADQIGIVPAFRRYVGPEAILFLPDPTVINPMLETATWPGDLDWRPEFVVVSASGDLALTTGPSVWRVGENADLGVYFSIWKRRPDGAWKFAIDGNTPMAEDLYALPGTPPEILAGRGETGAPTTSIQALESVLAADASRDARDALLSRLDPRGRVMRANAAPAIGVEAARALLTSQPPMLDLRLIDGGMAASGDLAYGYGEARWSEGAARRRGYWARVWRRDGDVWRIVFDQLNIRPEA